MSSDVHESPGPPGDPPPPQPSQQPMDTSQSSPERSFKESLMSNLNIENPLFHTAATPMDTVVEESDGMSQDESDSAQPKSSQQPRWAPPPWEPEEVSHEIIDGRPSVHISTKVVQKLSEPWSKSVVVKLFGGTIGYTALVTRLQKLWQPSGLMQVIDLEENFFVVRFASESDWSHALCDGPWPILGTYLLVQKWSPFFSIAQGITHVAVWVRFPQLPVLWYNRHILTYLGNLIGETVKIDMNTQQGYRGRFARMAVLIDISKPLRDKFELNSQWYNIEYEGLHTICFKCGRMGHTKLACHYMPDPQDREEGGSKVNEGPPTEGADEHNVMHEENGNPPEQDKFGPWLQARRPNRQTWKQTSNPENGEKLGGNMGRERSYRPNGRNKAHVNGSRFNALTDIEQNETGMIVAINKGQPSSDLPSSNGPKPRASTSQEDIREEAQGEVNVESSNFQFNVKGMESTGPTSGISKGSKGGKSEVRNKASGSKPTRDAAGDAKGPQPITVGPLLHGKATGVGITAGRTMNNKIRKLQPQKDGENTRGGAQDVASKDMVVAVSSGSGNLMDTGEEDPVVRKTARNRTGIVLGKRKTVTLANAEALKSKEVSKQQHENQKGSGHDPSAQPPVTVNEDMDAEEANSHENADVTPTDQCMAAVEPLQDISS